MGAILDVVTPAQLQALTRRGATTTGAYRVHPEASGVGWWDFGLASPDVAIFDFQPGFVWTGPQGSAYPAVSLHAFGVECYGGEVTNPRGGKIGTGGGDGVKVSAATGDTRLSFRWWGLYVHDVAAQGFSAQGNIGVTNRLDVKGESARCGLNTALDPHTDKGTGLHGAYIGGGSAPTSGRFEWYAHDQPTGAGVEAGAYCQNIALRIAAHRMTWPKPSAGAGFQPWGAHNSSVVVEYLAVDSAQYAIYAGSLSSGPVTVQSYAARNCAHADVLNSHITVWPT